jgi:hypothetical protein
MWPDWVEATSISDARRLGEAAAMPSYRQAEFDPKPRPTANLRGHRQRLVFLHHLVGPGAKQPLARCAAFQSSCLIRNKSTSMSSC